MDETTMQGFITDTELDIAEQEFPGIAQLFCALVVKPRTFLELVAMYDGWLSTPMAQGEQSNLTMAPSSRAYSASPAV